MYLLENLENHENMPSKALNNLNMFFNLNKKYSKSHVNGDCSVTSFLRKF